MPVYRRALEIAKLAEEMAGRSQPHRGDLRDQLRRASASIALNIAEGAGEFSPAEKVRFYRMARRSATEVAAAVDLVVETAPTSIDSSRMINLCTEVVAMLTLLIRSIEDRRS